ncbi:MULTISPECIES: response regulator [unclassified Sphingobacterium]|uniref:response regulator n=1 Tax=unclassified Sphingobacterium TaxID=2609468 RepID=UPI0025F95238|nr:MULTISPECIES: response regulator [unclassified Sphingobacterium]MDR0263895.1 response regulator [Sphingobacterium sp.]
MSNKTILMLDDDKHVLEICTIILETNGYNMAVSETSHDIIEKVEEVRPDLILMDNWIPKIGGVEATRLLKNHPLYRNIPVIYLSANTDIETLAQQAGADSYLAKPFDLEDLENRIAELL